MTEATLKTVTTASEEVVLATTDIGGDEVAHTTRDTANLGQLPPEVDAITFYASEYTPLSGTSSTLYVEYENTGSSSTTFTVNVSEDGSVFSSQSVTLGAGETTTLTYSRTKSSGRFSYGATGFSTLTVTWTNLDIQRLTASPNPASLDAAEDTISLSVSVSNPTSGAIGVGVRFYNATRATYVGSGQSTTLAANGQEVFKQELTRNESSTEAIYAEVTDDSIGVTAITNTQLLRWVADSDRILELDPKDGSVQYFGDSTTDWGPGTYELYCDGWASVWDFGHEGWTCRNDENYDKYFAYGPCWRNPWLLYENTEVQMRDLIPLEDVIYEERGSGSGTFSKDADSPIGIEVRDEPLDDNIGDLTFVITKL